MEINEPLLQNDELGILVKIMLVRIATRPIHTTRHAKDLRPLLKQMFADHQSKQKPMDLGTAFILISSDGL